MSATCSDSTLGRAAHDVRHAARMTREQFIAKCLKRSGGTEEQLLEYHEISECRCGKKKCTQRLNSWRGWRN